jgi:hypothetical protein
MARTLGTRSGGSPQSPSRRSRQNGKGEPIPECLIFDYPPSALHQHLQYGTEQALAIPFGQRPHRSHESFTMPLLNATPPRNASPIFPAVTSLPRHEANARRDRAPIAKSGTAAPNPKAIMTAATLGRSRFRAANRDAAQSVGPTVQAICKMDDIGWKPHIFLTNVSVSVAVVMRPTGPEKAVGVVSTFFVKDPTDPTWNDDSGMREWRAFKAVWKRSLPGERDEAGRQPARSRTTYSAAWDQNKYQSN